MALFFRIGKIDAARRQIVTAVQLFFSNGDYVSIHALSAAANDVLCDINKTREMKTDFEMAEEKYIKPEALVEFRKKINSVRNFLKHADRDPDAFLELSPRFVEILLWMTIHTYRSMTGDSDLFISAYVSWFMVNNPSVFNLSPEMQEVSTGLAKKYDMVPPSHFLTEVIPLLIKSSLIKTTL